MYLSMVTVLNCIIQSRPIIFVGHSMGGILILQVGIPRLCEPNASLICWNRRSCNASTEASILVGDCSMQLGAYFSSAHRT